MITTARGLDDHSLAAIADLEREVVAADGGRLKLEWGVLRSREADLEQDLLWWDGDRLLGYLGLYAFGPPDIEVAGMVAPDARRQGIGNALLAQAKPLARARGYQRVLLVVPAATEAGRAFAQAQAGIHDHSEHFLALARTPIGPDRDPQTRLRPITTQDRPAVRQLLAEGFDWELPPDLFDHPKDTTYVVERSGVIVGTARLSVHDDVGGIYGFVVSADLRGQGIGRDVLERLCRLLREQGCARVTLEVATENDRALGLYLSTGFVREAGEDYWAVPL